MSISDILDILNSVKKSFSHNQLQYNNLKMDILEALVYYADCLHNPIDYSDVNTVHLSGKREEGCTKFRKLASTAEMLAETLRKPHCGIPLSSSDLHELSRNLLGLSNSFMTSHGVFLEEDMKFIRKCESEIKRILRTNNME